MNSIQQIPIAKLAAVIAGLGLVAMSFAALTPTARAQTSTATLQAQIQALLAQIAVLQAQLGVTATVPFTRDLTIGSTGADVMRLQQFLMGRGYAIPAGPTQYFGVQTRAALAAFQAANSIQPPAGYFGPITRGRINAMLSVTPTPDPSPSDDTLGGGEADLTDFELRSEDSNGSEAEDGVELATAEFDVEDGDVRVERAELEFDATNGSLQDRPWDFFDTIAIEIDGDEVADVDASDRDEWDEVDDDVYRISFTGIDSIVREGDTAELTFVADISRNIDTADLDQEFDITVPDDGIRAVDGEGIQHYIGDDADEVTFGFSAVEAGDIDIHSSADDPNAMTLISDPDDESDEYTVFAFELENNDDVEVLVTDLSIDINSATDGDDFIDTATLFIDGDDMGDGEVSADSIAFDDVDFEIDGDDTVEVELVITLRANAPDTTVSFDIDSADVTAESADEGDESDVSGSASSETHTIASTGLFAEGTGDSASTNSDQNLGTFTIEFEVTALEDDAYIYRGADTASSTTSGVIYTIYESGNATSTFYGSASALLQSSADTSGSYYVVREGQTEEFTLTVTLDPSASTRLYFIELEAIRFDTAADASAIDDATYTVPNTSAFETNAVSLRSS